MTRSEENYIKPFFNLGKKGDRGKWPPMPFAGANGNQALLVSDMIKKLSEKDLGKLQNDTKGFR